MDTEVLFVAHILFSDFQVRIVEVTNPASPSAGTYWVKLCLGDEVIYNVPYPTYELAETHFDALTRALGMHSRWCIGGYPSKHEETD